MLTHRQKELLTYLRYYMGHYGVAPTFAEMQKALGMASKSGVFRLLESLEERGFIRRMRERRRAIELIDDPHLPLGMSRITDQQLAREAERRGMVLGYWLKVREKVGTGFIEMMRFHEVPLVLEARNAYSPRIEEE